MVYLLTKWCCATFSKVHSLLYLNEGTCGAVLSHSSTDINYNYKSHLRPTLWRQQHLRLLQQQQEK